MKNNVKSRLVCLMLVVSMMLTLIVPVGFAAGAIQISVDSVKGTAGSTVTVPVNISNIPTNGCSSGMFNIDFDSSMLTYKSITAGNVVGNSAADISVSPTSTGLTVLYSDYNQTGSSHIQNDGVLCTLTFLVASSATGKIVVTPNTTDSFYDKDVKTLPAPTFVAGSIDLGGSSATSTPTKTATVTPKPTSGITTATPTPQVVGSDLNVSVGTVSGKPGDSVSVLVNMANIPTNGLSSGMFNIDYNTSDLTFVSLTAGDIVYNGAADISASPVETGLTILYSDYEQTGASYISKAGLFCTLNFKISATSPNGVIKLNTNSTNSFYDKNVNAISEPTFISGSVTVSGSTITATPTPKATATPTPKVVGSDLNIFVGAASGKPGDTVSVPVNMANIPTNGLSSGMFNIDYNTSNLTFVSLTAGDIVYNGAADISASPVETGLTILYSDYEQTGTSYISKAGLFCTLNFKISATSPNGEIKLNANSTNSFYDKNVNAVSAPTFISGSVTVSGSTITATPTTKATATPTIKATATPTTKPTATSTPTATPTGNANGSVSVVMSSGPSFRVTNTGNSAISLSSLSFKYFYTNGGKTQVYDTYYAATEWYNNTQGITLTSNIKSTIASSYLELKIDSSATLIAGQSLTIQGALHNTDWSTLATSTVAAAYLNGVKVWGEEGTGSSTPTSTPTKTPTPTKPTTITITKTPTPTPIIGNGMVITVGNVNGANGSTVSVPVNLSKVSAKGFSTGIINVDYDTTKLTFKSITAGDIVYNGAADISSSTTSTGLKVMYSDYEQTGSSYISKDGLFFTIEFTVVATTGKVALTASTTDDFYDKDVNPLAKPSFVSGSVSVSDVNAMKITVGSVKALGSTVSVPVNIANVPENGCASGMFNIDYDTSKLTFSKIIAGDIVYNEAADISASSVATGLTILYSDYEQTGTSYISADGLFCTLEFTVVTTTGEVALNASTENSFYDKDVNEIATPSFVSGKVIIDGTLTPTNTPTPTTTGTSNAMKITVESVAATGSTVSVPVNISKVPANGCSSGMFNIDYDTSKLTFNKIIAGDIVTNKGADISASKVETGITVLYSDYDQTGTSYISADGLFCTIEFTVVATSGEVALNASTEESFYDKDVNEIEKPSFVSGKVVIGGTLTPTNTPTPTTTGTSNAMKITVGSVAATGSTVSVPVNISNVPANGCSSGMFNIDYDTSKLTFSKIIAGNIVTNTGADISASKVETGITVLYSDYDQTGTSYISADGLFCTIEFTVVATSGEVALNASTENSFYDKDVKEIEKPSFVSGKVVIGGTLTPTTTPITTTPTNTPTNTPTPTTTGTSNAMKISVGSVTGNVGDTVKVEVNVAKVPASGFASGMIDIAYDETKLTYSKLTAGPIVTNEAADISASKVETGLRILYSDYDQTGTSYISSDGLFCTLEFTINATAVDGDVLPLTATSTESFYDKDISTIETPEFVSGNITVGKVATIVYGDVNGDGSVRANDYAMIRDYVIGKIEFFMDSNGNEYAAGILAADVNKDGSIRANDYAIVRDYVIGKVEVLPYVQ